jgi:tetratricopeptide (TPR) repeat protein
MKYEQITLIFKRIFLFCAILFALGCTKSRKVTPVLSDIEKSMVNNFDSAWAMLDTLNFKTVDPYNKSYYYLLLTEGKYRNDSSLLASDTLMDFALANLDKKKDKLLTAKALLFKARIQSELNNTQEAIRYYDDAQAILKKNNIEQRKILSIIYDDLGKLYNQQHQHNEALAMFWEGYYSDIVTSYKVGQTISLKNIGCTYFYLQKPDIALYYLKQALALAQLTPDSISLKDDISADITAHYGNNGAKNESYSQEYEKLMTAIESIAKTDELQIINQKHKMETAIIHLKTEHKHTLEIVFVSSLLALLLIIFVFVVRDKKKKIVRQKQENELITLQLHISQLQCETFRSKPIYNQIIQSSQTKNSPEEKIIVEKERQELRDEIKITFATFINNLRAACPALTEDEILHCCLAKLNLDTATISLCFGYTDTHSTRQRKTRIKKKMADFDCENIFDSIFVTL